MKKRILALILTFFLYFSSGCGENEKNSTSIDDVREKISTSTVSDIINELDDCHTLDEHIETMNYKSGKNFSDLENDYKSAMEKEDYQQADSTLNLMYKMIIASKLSDLSGIDPQQVLNNMQLPSLQQLCDSENNAYILLNGKKYYISVFDKDQFKRLMLNCVNASLAAQGYDRPNAPYDRYRALKESALMKVELDIFRCVTGEYDDEKIKRLVKVPNTK